MLAETDYLEIPWEFIEKQIVQRKNTEHANDLRYGWFINPRGVRLTVSEIDVEAGRASTLEPSETGLGIWIVSSLIHNGSSALHVKPESMSKHLKSEVAAYRHKIEQAERIRLQAIEKARIESEQRSLLERQREEERVEKQRREEEQQRKRAQQWQDTINDLQRSFETARLQFVKSVESDLRCDLSDLLPCELDWSEVLLDQDNPRSTGITVEAAHNQIGRICNFTPWNGGSYLQPCGAFRKLLEPQVVVAIGDILHVRGYAKIAPTYAGALMDLGLDQEAYEACMVYWSSIELEEAPRYLTSAFHRACRLTNNHEMRRAVEDFARRKGIELGGASSTLPLDLRQDRMNKLWGFRRRNQKQ